MVETLLLILTLALPAVAGAAELPIFDAHLHYSHDAWDVVPVEQALAILRKAGVRRALVSSSGDDGLQRLYRAAPDVIIPALRPYRRRGEIGTWFKDESVITYLEDRLGRFKYVALGEYNRRVGDGADAIDAARLAFEHAVGLDPNLPSAQRELGLLYRAQGRSVEASTALARYLALTPEAIDRPIIESYIAESAATAP